MDGKVAPEENTGVIAELLKYGVFKPGATVKSILQAIVNDTKLPRWVRTIVNLLIKVDAGWCFRSRCITGRRATGRRFITATLARS